jgi:threonine aldolase
MTKYSFKNDYSEGAHQNIIEALAASNYKQEAGYGEDSFCEAAKKAIKDKTGNQNSEIHFVSGGTQTNLIVISSVLKPYESVIAPSSGHIAVHEAGAIEATGHKINTVESEDGKLSVKSIQAVINSHNDEHMVKPRLVYISNSTEIGSIYKKDELNDISTYCKDNNLYLFADGARLGSALTSPKNDLTLSEFSNYVDMFYVGGTKNGALLGEAIVINNDTFKENFRYNLKQKGALLAKGRILGIQFLELFRENLFFDIGEHANSMALKLADAIKSLDYTFFTEPESNQIFPILPNKLIQALEKKYSFYIWKKIDKNHSVIRLVTSWATNEKVIDNFISDLN